MDRNLRRYYKRVQHGGRGALARSVDYIALRLVFGAACYLWFRLNVPNTVAATILTIVTIGMFFIAARLIRELRFEKFVQRENQRLTHLCMLEELTLLQKDDFARSIEQICSGMPEAKGAAVYYLQRLEPVTPDAILNIYRTAAKKGAKNILLFSTATCTDAARALIKRLPIALKLVGPEELLSLYEQLDVSQVDILARIKSEQEAHELHRKRLQHQPFVQQNAIKYLVCAGILLLTSFITRFGFYYRMLAMVCLLLAGTTFWMHTGRSQTLDQ